MQSQQGGQPLPNTWALFEQALTRRFQPLAEEELARNRLIRLRQSHTGRRYCLDFNDLILRIPTMDEQSRLSYFLNGLQTDVRHEVKRVLRNLPEGAIRDVEAAMIAAEEYEADLQQDAALEASFSRRARDRLRTRGNAMDVDHLSANHTNVNTGGRGGRGGGGGRQLDLSKVDCYNCGKFGHFAKDCPHPPAAGRGRGGFRGGRGGRGGGGGRGERPPRANHVACDGSSSSEDESCEPKN
jgi:hypothetical protein